MSIKVHKFLKDDLSYVNEVSVSMSNTNGLTISHFTCAIMDGESTLPFTIEGVEKYIPQIEVDFCVVSRKKVDLAAIGPNSKIIKDIGKDKGKYNYKDSSPVQPLDLPPGFTELYKK